MSEQPEVGDVVTVQRAADLAGVCRRTIYHWIKSGKVETIKTAGGRVRILRRTLFRQADGSSLERAS